MQVKLIAILFVVLMLSGLAAAAAPAIAVLNQDGNYYYPSKTTTILWTVSDADDPTDFNFIISYVSSEIWTGSVEITSLTGAAGAPDRNSNNFCSSPVGTAQLCSYDWTLPTGLDANYTFDINGYDITNSDDINAIGGDIYIDSNACDTQFSEDSDTITLTTVCTGYGTTGTTYYGYSRQSTCPDKFLTYSSPFDLTFGEFLICYYSTDGLGNTEITQTNIHTADSGAYNLALLAEMLLAALLLMVILGAVILRGESLNGPLMIGLTLAAVIIAISIYIFAVIL